VSDLTRSSAIGLAAAIRERRVSAREVVEAHISLLERVNPRINAVVVARYDAARREGATLTAEQALEVAWAAPAAGEGPEDEELQALTSRELEVLRLLTRELTDAQIAQELVVSRRTVHAHLRSIYRKLDVGSRLAAARWAARHGLGR
jgi:DNA-binding NarL/FixJ family response regulator